MSKSIIPMPFVCKWSDAHSTPCRFETQEKLIIHIDEHINFYNKPIRRDSFYICPWEGCKKHQSDIIELKGHLRKHGQQRPFKCPICDNLRFSSSDTLNRHLITNHNDSYVDSDTDGDTSLYDENENLNLGKVEVGIVVKEKVNRYGTDVLVEGKAKDKIIQKSNTATLSYRDVLVKGTVNKGKNTEDKKFVKGTVNKDKNTEDKKFEDLSFEEYQSRCYQHHREVQDLFIKAMGAIALLPEEKVEYYDWENVNVEDLPDAPQEVLPEAEQEILVWKAFIERYKGSLAAEYIGKAIELKEKGPF